MIYKHLNSFRLLLSPPAESYQMHTLEINTNSNKVKNIQTQFNQPVGSAIYTMHIYKQWRNNWVNTFYSTRFNFMYRADTYYAINALFV